MTFISRRTAIGGMLATAPALAVAAWAQPPIAGSGADLATGGDGEMAVVLDAWTDTYGRPTTSVFINGRGPFSFLVDTGSTVTVLSERVTKAIGAEIGGTFTIAGATGTAVRPYTDIETLTAGDVSRSNLRVAILEDPRLSRGDGILGADLFVGKRLVFAIREKTVRVEPSRRRSANDDLRNLRLRQGLLAEVDGQVGNVNAHLILDTGADHCVGNPALGAALERAHPRLVRIPRVRLTGVTGHKIIGEFVYLPRINASAFSVQDSAAVIADLPIFKLWELESQPAMIVGVDLLSRLTSFTIDYGARVFDAQLADAGDLIAHNSAALG
jgi:predicted aspartyl protease